MNLSEKMRLEREAHAAWSAKLQADLDAQYGPDAAPAKKEPGITTAPVKKSAWDYKSVGNIVANWAARAPLNVDPVPTNRKERRRSSKFSREARHDFARDLESFRRETRTKGESGRTNQGAISSMGVEIVKALAFDFWNKATGRTDPGHKKLAAQIGCHPSTVARQLKAAREHGIISWVRRLPFFIAGAWRRRTNSYQFGWPTTPKRYLEGKEGSVAPLPRLTDIAREVADTLAAKFAT